jgi:drug/metabolite transporter (DMT)-like permease
VVSVVFALLTAVFNGTASVLQRRAAATAPPEKALHLALLAYLVKHKIWLAGIVMTIAAALAQATALATGPVALVQPIFIIELPFTLLLASRMVGRNLPRMTWAAVAIVTVSLGAGLAAAAPSGGSDTAGTQEWMKALIVTACFEFILLVIGVKASGNARAAAFGLAAACGYALTAALMKNAMAALSQGVVPFFTCWQLYATAAAGVGSLFILQNSLQAGSLIATQPALTLGDALISVSYGVTLFGESLRTGGWLIIEIAAVLAIGFGCIELSRSLGIIERRGTPPAQNPNPTLEAMPAEGG